MVNGEHSRQIPPVSPYGNHDFADFAQEFLRRNPAYCQTVSSLPGQARSSEGEAQQWLARTWGLCQLIDPAASPRTCPALWQPACHPAIVQIRCSHQNIEAVLPKGYAPLAEHREGNAYHLVLGRAAQHLRLRLCLWHAPDQDPPLLCLSKDSSLAIRLGAAAFYATTWRTHKADPTAPFQPSAYQRASLVRLLQICDALATGASCRHIASTIVFPRHERLTGIAWKGSAERRHCWRLIGQARQLRNGGHLRLLALARPACQA